jgi:ATP synthase protein I
MAVQPGGGANGRDSDAELARRLDRLSRDLRAEQIEQAAANDPGPSRGGDYGRAFKLASEFVAGILAGGAVGWGIDWLAGTSPWGLIGFLLLGFGAGVVNVVRSSRPAPAASATKHRGEGGGPI